LSNTSKDINSTEKLLNVIRGKDEASFGGLGKQKISLTPDKKTGIFQSGFLEKFLSKKKYTVGIDIGREFICLAKTAMDSNHQPILVDKKIITIDPRFVVGSPEFNQLIKTSVLNFCGNVADCDIWAKISTSQVGVYFFTIPRVPKKQIQKVIFWTAKKEGFYDEEKQIFDFEIHGELVEQGTPKYSVMFYTAQKAEVARIKSFADNIGINLKGITIVPFAMQNIFRSKWIPASEEIFASLFIGDNYSRIDVYDKENLVMTRGIKTGSLSSMAEAVVAGFSGRKGDLKLDQTEAKQIVCTMRPESGGAKEADDRKKFAREDILNMIVPVWERLARQIDLTLKTSPIGNKKVEKMYVLSPINFDQSLLDYMGNQLDTRIEIFDPFKNRKSVISEQSLSSSERILISPALGFALSDNSRTPNAVFTYEEKRQDIKSRRINKVIFMAFLAALVVCIGTLFYQGSKFNTLKKNNLALEKELALFSPMVSQETILQEVNRIKLQRDAVRQYAQKYLGLAVIGEISDMTPENVRLMNLRLQQTAGSPAAAGQKTEHNGLVLEGIIFGKKDLLESELTQYVLKLENSALFNTVSVQSKNIINFDKKDVIHFVISAKQGS